MSRPVSAYKHGEWIRRYDSVEDAAKDHDLTAAIIQYKIESSEVTLKGWEFYYTPKTYLDIEERKQDGSPQLREISKIGSGIMRGIKDGQV